MSASLPTYWTGVATGRAEVNHGFTIRSLLELRRKQQLAPIMISFNWATPFFNATQNQIKTLEEEAERTGKKPSNEDLLPILTNAATAATKNWAGVLVRVGLQTAIASALIHKNTDLSNSVVLNWDMYPRMHQKYCGDFLQKIFLPRSLASLLGPATKPEDIVIWEQPVTPLAAAQDSFKRHALVSASNVTVTMAMHLALYGLGEDPQVADARKRAAAAGNEKVAQNKTDFISVAKTALMSETLSLVGCMAGSAVGRMIGGGRAEYWTEFLGAFAAGAAGTILVVMSAPEIKSPAETKQQK